LSFCFASRAAGGLVGLASKLGAVQSQAVLWLRWATLRCSGCC